MPDCRPTETDVRTCEAQLAAAQAAFDRAHNGIAAPGTGARGKDVVAIALDLEHGIPALPIGLPVTVHLSSCTPKT